MHCFTYTFQVTCIVSPSLHGGVIFGMVFTFGETKQSGGEVGSHGIGSETLEKYVIIQFTAPILSVITQGTNLEKHFLNKAYNMT